MTNSKQKRKSIVERDGTGCAVCSCMLRMPGDPKKDHPKESRAATIHHRVGIAEGGTHKEENLCLVCRPCHNEIHNEPAAKLAKAKLNLIAEIKKKHQLLQQL